MVEATEIYLFMVLESGKTKLKLLVNVDPG